MPVSSQNRVLPFLGADLRPAEPSLPSLSAIGVLDLARLYRDNPAEALRLAEGNARDHWADVRRKHPHTA